MSSVPGSEQCHQEIVPEKPTPSLRDYPTREELDEELDTTHHESGDEECRCQPCQNLLWLRRQDAHVVRVSLATPNNRYYGEHHALYSISV